MVSSVLTAALAAALMLALWQFLTARRLRRAIDEIRAAPAASPLVEAEERFKQREAHFRSLLRDAPLKIALKDTDGRYLEVSHSWEHEYGIDADKVVGLTPEAVFGGPLVEEFLARDREVLRTGKALEMEEIVPHSDGTDHRYLTTRFPVLDFDGEVVGLWLVATDITALANTERALRESEEQLRTITDNLPASIVRWDKHQRYTFANRLAEEWYGGLSPTIVGKTIDELFGDAISPDTAAAIETALSGEAVRFETTLRYPDGITRDVEIAYIPDITDDGAVEGVFALVQDIRERKAAEQALRDSEAQIRTITDNLPVLVTYRDREGHFRFVNRVAEAWYARPASEIIGRTSQELLPADDHTLMQAKVRVVLAGQAQHYETAASYPDGVTRDVDVTYIPDIAGDGVVRGWFGLVQDVTGRKKLEADLLRQERLAALGQLTGTVAHELRNPLGAITMSLGVIRQRAGDTVPGLQRALDRAGRGMARCERIVTDLLDFARARGLQRQPTALDKWLNRTLDELEIPDSVAVRRNIAVDTVAPPVDREVLRRAVINVVENACQALTEQKIDEHQGARYQLEVALQIRNGRVEMVFADDGPGIPGEILPRVIEPLFSTRSFGTGLGLPTVYRIMEEHGGGMEIESEPGRGTRVVLWLPADERHEEISRR